MTEISFENMIGESSGASFEDMLGDVPELPIPEPESIPIPFQNRPSELPPEGGGPEAFGYEMVPSIKPKPKVSEPYQFKPIPMAGVEIPIEDMVAATGYRGHLDKTSNESYSNFMTRKADQVRSIIADTVSGMYGFASQPLETQKGIIATATQLPFVPGAILDAVTIGGREFVDQILDIKLPLVDYYGKGRPLPINLKEVYFAGGKAFHKHMEAFRPLLEAQDKLIGQPTEVSQRVGEVFMAPLTGTTMTTQAIADHPILENYPNIQGALLISGEAVGFALMARFLHRSKKDWFRDKIRKVSEDGEFLWFSSKEISKMPEGPLKKAQQDIWNAKAKQAELEAGAIADELGFTAETKHEILVQQERLAKKKLRPTEKTQLYPKPKAKVKEEKKVEPKLEPPPSEGYVASIEGPDGTIYNGVKGVNHGMVADSYGLLDKIGKDTGYIDGFTDSKGKFYTAEELTKKLGKKFTIVSETMFPKEFGLEAKVSPALTKMRERFKKLPVRVDAIGEKGTTTPVGELQVTITEGPAKGTTLNVQESYTAAGQEIVAKQKEFKKAKAKVERKEVEVVEEPITDLDQATGTKIPEMEGERSPFYQDAETTEVYRKLYEDRAKSVSEDVELFTQKLINDANRWYKGDESIDIGKVRQGLSDLATSTDPATVEGFLTGRDHLLWKETVSDAATWASRLDRSKIERTGEQRLLDTLEDSVPGTFADAKPKIDYFGEGKEKGPELYSGFPVDKAAELLKKTYRKFKGKVIKTVNRNQTNLLKDLTKLHTNDKIDVDITYSTGRMWKGTGIEPIHKFDQRVEAKGVIQADIIKGIPLEDNSVNSVMFDPPFLVKGKPEQAGLMGKRFTAFKSVDELWSFYKQGVNESFRVLAPGGKLITKTQDITTGKGIFASSSEIYNFATQAGFRPIDRFIYENVRPLPLAPNILIQAHARKVHSDFWVFEKPKRKYAYPEEGGVKLYSGLPLDKELLNLGKSMLKGVGEFFNEFKKTDELTKFNFLGTVKQIKTDIDKAFLDQSENILKQIRKKYPEDYNEIATKMRSAITGKGYGSLVFEQASKEIYSGKSNIQKQALDAYILARRFKDIYSYVPESKYKHQPGYGSEQTITVTSFIEMVKDLPSEQWKALKDKFPEYEEIFGDLTTKQMGEVVRAGETYFEHIRTMIDGLVEVGIKSSKEGELLKSHDYSKFKSLYIDKIYDFEYDLNLKGETIKSTSSGVVRLGSGSVKIIDKNTKLALSETLARGYGSISNQVAKLAWKDFSLKHPDNGFVHPGTGVPKGWKRVKGKGIENIFYDPNTKNFKEYKDSNAESILDFYKSNPESVAFSEGTGLTVPSGWSLMPYLDNGIKKNLAFHPDAAKYLITQNKDISHRLTTLTKWGTLAPITRQLAVGSSPVWATLLGLPMDVGHSLWTAKTWEVGKGIKPKLRYPFYETTGGKFKKLYNPYFPLVDKLQLGKDMQAVYRDVYNKGPIFQALTKHGLVMNFLTQRQGKYMKGVKPPGDWAKLLDLSSAWGLKMELWPRVAVGRRIILNEAKKKGITFDQALKDSEIMYKAAHAARDRMDYNQGGWFIKALDHSGLNFLNAAVLGTRTFWREAVTSPVEFIFRTARIGTTAAGITYAAWSMYPEEMKNMRDDPRSVQWPIAPDHLRDYDRDGNPITFHFKLRMDPNIAFIYKFFEGVTKKIMYDKGMTKVEPDYKALVESLKKLGPIDIQLWPLVQGSLEYRSNYSWWQGDDIYKEMGGKTFDWPRSAIEGAKDPRVSQIAKDIAGVTDVSPKRLEGAGSSIIPYNNEFVQIMTTAYEGIRGDLPEGIKLKSWLLTLANLPGFDRVVGITRHGTSRFKAMGEVDDDILFKKMVLNADFDDLVERYAWYGEIGRKEVTDFISKQEDREVVDRFKDELKFAERVKGLQYRSFWLSFKRKSLEGKARTFNRMLNESNSEEQKQLWDELNLAYRAMYDRKNFIDARSEFKKELRVIQSE